MRISLASIYVRPRDFEKAIRFYTDILGFRKKQDIAVGDGERFVTVVSPEEPDGTELVIEPNGDYPAVKSLKESLVRDGIPFTAFEVEDIRAAHERLRRLGVVFVKLPTHVGPVIQAVFDDTCGNLIMIYQRLLENPP